jgi:PmbA protein
MILSQECGDIEGRRLWFWPGNVSNREPFCYCLPMPELAAQPDLTELDLESLTTDVVALAMKAGASDAEAVAREGDEFSVNVRMGQVETLKESGSRGLGLRVFLGTRSASASTSDLTADGIRQLVDGALALAKVTEEDPFAGLPETAEFGSVEDDLHLYYDDVYSLSGPERIEWARRGEAAALAADPRITNSDGGSFDAATGRKAMANSRGFAGGYRSSYAGVSVAPLAMDANGAMQRDGWWSGARRLNDLESPESIGKEAARRTLRRLGARRVATQRVPIIFAPEVARSLIVPGRPPGRADRRARTDHHRRQHHAAAHRRGRLRQLSV